MKKEKQNELLRISEFAEIAEVSRKGLIFYDNIGVFSPEYTAPNGYRYYSHEQIYLISVISMLRELDTPLRQIQEYMQNSTPGNAVTLLEKQGAKIEQKIIQLQRIQNMLQIKLERLKTGVETQISDIRIIEQKEMPLFISDPFSLPKKCIMDDIWSSFYRKCKEKELTFGYPEGFMVNHDDLCMGRTNIATHIIWHVGKKGDANACMPAGKYLTICGRGSFGDTEPLYQALLDYVKNQNLTIVGHAYEERLIDEIASKDKEIQKIEVKMQVL